MKTLSRKIEWCNTPGGIAQVYSSGLQYAFCSIDFKQILPWIYCKDFLHDIVFSQINGNDLSIYGYQYQPSTHPKPNMRRLRMMMTNKSDEKFGDKVLNSVDLLNQVERALKIPSLTKVFLCPEPPQQYEKCGVYIFSGSAHWLLSPPMLSMYTLMARAGFSHTKGVPFMETISGIIDGKIKPYQIYDASQLTGGKAGIERLIKDGYLTIFGKDMKTNYRPGISVGEMHNCLGIVSFSKEVTKKYFPVWHQQAPATEAVVVQPS